MGRIRLNRPEEISVLTRLLDTPVDRHGSWVTFLQQYSRLLIKIIRQFEKDHDAIMEKYVFVCSRLVDDDFSLLRKFKPGPARFTTWLVVVVRNLCIEEHRNTVGRFRYPALLKGASEMERKVYALRFWKGYSNHEIVEMLTADGVASLASVQAALDRLETMDLRPSKTWERHRLQHVHLKDEFYSTDRDETLVAFENLDEIEHLISSLSDEERTVVRLRYWGELTARDISTVTALPQRRVYSVLTSAINQLKNRHRIEARKTAS